VRLTRSPGEYWKVAHRGASALAPENSLAALEAALGARVDVVELDVVAVGDELRLAHSLEQLRLDTPTLGEALALFAARAPAATWLVLDVKTPGVEPALVAALGADDLLARTLVTSFHAGILRAVKRLKPEVAVGLSYPNDSLGLHRLRPLSPLVNPGLALLRQALPLRVGRMLARADADAAMLQHRLVSPKVVARCHAAGAAVFAWTVESDDDLRRVLAAGADGVIADDPNLFDD
jgi:glycerophosphoryl diester phosphodiesterase